MSLVVMPSTVDRYHSHTLKGMSEQEKRRQKRAKEKQRLARRRQRQQYEKETKTFNELLQRLAHEEVLDSLRERLRMRKEFERFKQQVEADERILAIRNKEAIKYRKIPKGALL